MTIAGKSKQFTWGGGAATSTTSTTPSDPMPVDGAPFVVQELLTGTSATVNVETTSDPATAAGASGAANWDKSIAGAPALVVGTPTSTVVNAPVLAVRLNPTAITGTLVGWVSR